MLLKTLAGFAVLEAVICLIVALVFKIGLNEMFLPYCLFFLPALFGLPFVIGARNVHKPKIRALLFAIGMSFFAALIVFAMHFAGIFRWILPGPISEGDWIFVVIFTVLVVAVSSYRRAQKTAPRRLSDETTGSPRQVGSDVERRITRTWANPSWWFLLAVLPWTIGTIFLVHQWLADRGIATRERTTQGVVNAYEPANHNRYEYVFSVNGKSFSGWQSPGPEGLEIGKRVLVYYDPIDPNRNALIEFEDRSTDALGPVPLVLFGIGAVAWYIRTRRVKESNLAKSNSGPVTPTSP
jgi:hypothetical protein